MQITNNQEIKLAYMSYESPLSNIVEFITEGLFRCSDDLGDGEDYY